MSLWPKCNLICHLMCNITIVIVSARLLWKHRDEVRCREKWTNVLDSTSIDTKPFTAQEDAIIMEEASQAAPTTGSSSIGWSRIAALLRGRTDSQCLRRWKDLSGPVQTKLYVESSKKRRAITVPRHSR